MSLENLDSAECSSTSKQVQEDKSMINLIDQPHTTSSSNDDNVMKPVVCSISSSSMVCRICQMHSPIECLISPCSCKGTLAHVHLSCLERWLNQACRTYCELCMFKFNAIETQRYGFFEGLRLWVRHPRNRNHLQSDLVIAALLTTVTVGLITVCLLGMQYFVIEAKKIGISHGWTQGFIIGFLCIIVLGYMTTLYLIMKDQLLPWYNWWKSTVDVKLLLTPSVTNGLNKEVEADLNSR